MKTWSSLVCVLVLCAAGCAEGAKLAQANQDGGVVTYPFKGDQGHMLSSFRKDALAADERHVWRRLSDCARRRSERTSARGRRLLRRTEIVRERRWGIRVRCSRTSRTQLLRLC